MDSNFEAHFGIWYRRHQRELQQLLGEKAKDDFHGGHGYVELEDDGRSHGNLSYVGSSSTALSWSGE